MTANNNETVEMRSNSIKLLTELLSYTTKPDNAAILANKLINACGSLSAVIEAPYSLLIEFGLSSNQAVLIRMIPPLSRKYLDNKYYSCGNKKIMDSKSKIITAFLGMTTERVIIILKDKKDTELYFGTLSSGSLNVSEVYIKRVMELALRYNAHSAVIAHNHPSGIPYPSERDVESTIKIKNVLKAVNVVLENHIIVAGTKAFSMAESEEFYEIFI